MILALTEHAPAFALCAACFVLTALLDEWDRANRRRAAQRAERRARPATGQQDTAALAAQAIAEGWTYPTEGDQAP